MLKLFFLQMASPSMIKYWAGDRKEPVSYATITSIGGLADADYCFPTRNFLARLNHHSYDPFPCEVPSQFLRYNEHLVAVFLRPQRGSMLAAGVDCRDVEGDWNHIVWLPRSSYIKRLVNQVETEKGAELTYDLYCRYFTKLYTSGDFKWWLYNGKLQLAPGRFSEEENDWQAVDVIMHPVKLAPVKPAILYRLDGQRVTTLYPQQCACTGPEAKLPDDLINWNRFHNITQTTVLPGMYLLDPGLKDFNSDGVTSRVAYTSGMGCRFIFNFDMTQPIYLEGLKPGAFFDVYSWDVLTPQKDRRPMPDWADVCSVAKYRKVA
jgi:hypothetical protein